MTLAHYIIETKVVLFIRRNITYYMALAFIVSNWGYTLSAFKTAYSIFYIKLAFGKHTQTYIETSGYAREHILNFEHIQGLAYTLVHAGYVCFVGHMFIWFIDHYADHRVRTKKELRHLRKWAREEYQLLEEKLRIIITFNEKLALQKETQTALKRLEAVVLRYEQTAMQLNPSKPKRPKLSEKDDSLLDLFKDVEPTPKEKTVRQVKKIIFKPKT